MEVDSATLPTLCSRDSGATLIIWLLNPIAAAAEQDEPEVFADASLPCSISGSNVTKAEFLFGVQVLSANGRTSCTRTLTYVGVKTTIQRHVALFFWKDIGESADGGANRSSAFTGFFTACPEGTFTYRNVVDGQAVEFETRSQWTASGESAHSRYTCAIPDLACCAPAPQIPPPPD